MYVGNSRIYNGVTDCNNVKQVGARAELYRFTSK